MPQSPGPRSPGLNVKAKGLVMRSAGDAEAMVFSGTHGFAADPDPLAGSEDKVGGTVEGHLDHITGQELSL